MIIFIYYLREKQTTVKNIFRLTLLSCFVASIAIVFYYNIPTLNDKITNQIESVEENEVGSETSRLGTTILLSQLIAENPYLGIGFAVDKNYFENQITIFGYRFTEIGIGNGHDFNASLVWYSLFFCFYYF